MKSEMASIGRRQFLLAAGAAGAAAAFPLIAAQPDTVPTGKLIVSGRVIGADGKALAGTLIDVWHEKGRVSVTTDADGRFVFDTAATARLRYRLGGTGYERELHVARDGHLARDDEGAWRATFGLMVT